MANSPAKNIRIVLSILSLVENNFQGFLKFLGRLYWSGWNSTERNDTVYENNVVDIDLNISVRYYANILRWTH